MPEVTRWDRRHPVRGYVPVGRLREEGWGRATVEKGLLESCWGVRCLENFAARGRPRSEEKNPQLAEVIPENLYGEVGERA